MRVGARTQEEEKEIVKRALAMLQGKAEPGPTLAGKGRTDEFKPTAETLAASVLAEAQPDEVGRCSILLLFRRSARSTD